MNQLELETQRLDKEIERSKNSLKIGSRLILPVGFIYNLFAMWFQASEYRGRFIEHVAFAMTAMVSAWIFMVIIDCERTIRK